MTIDATTDLITVLSALGIFAGVRKGFSHVRDYRHKRWTRSAVLALRAKGRPVSLPVAEADRVHARWAVQEGLLVWDYFGEFGGGVALPGAYPDVEGLAPQRPRGRG